MAAAQKSASSTAKAEAARWKAVEATTKKIEREFAKEAAAAEKAAARETKAAEKSGKDRVRAEEKAAKERSRILQQAEREQSRAMDRELRERRRAARAAQQQSRVGLPSALGSGIALAAAGVSGIVVAGAGAVARDRNELQEKANRLSINSRGAGEAFVSSNSLRSEFERTALAVPGVKASDVADAASRFVSRTGDLKSARGMARTFATTSMASGAGMGDVAEAAAALRTQFGIKDDGQMKEALAALTFQGKAGAFEFSDAAGQLGKLSAAGSRFGLSRDVSGIKTLGGLTQIARSSTGSGEQAANAVEATLRQLVARATDGDVNIKDNFGVDVFKDKGQTQTRDVKDILVETIAGAKGNLPKLQKVFGEEGIRAISPLIAEFNRAGEAAGRNASQSDKMAAGTTAVRKMLDDSINAQGSWAEVQKDAAQASQDATARVTAAWELVASRLGESFVPAIEATAAMLENIEGPVDMLGEGIAGTTGRLEKFGESLSVILKRMGIGVDEPGAPTERKREQLQGVTREIQTLEGKRKRSRSEEYRLTRLKEKREGLVEEVGANAPAVKISDGSSDIERVIGTSGQPLTDRPTYDWGPGEDKPEQSFLERYNNSVTAGAVTATAPGAIIGGAMNIEEIINGLGDLLKGTEPLKKGLGEAAAAATSAARELQKVGDASRPNIVGGARPGS